MVQKNTQKKRHLQIIKKKQEEKETRVAIGAPAYRRTNERRAAASTKNTKTKQSKTKVTPDKDVMASSANQTPGGYKFV